MCEADSGWRGVRKETCSLVISSYINPSSHSVSRHKLCSPSCNLILLSRSGEISLTTHTLRLTLCWCYCISNAITSCSEGAFFSVLLPNNSFLSGRKCRLMLLFAQNLTPYCMAWHPLTLLVYEVDCAFVDPAFVWTNCTERISSSRTSCWLYWVTNACFDCMLWCEFRDKNDQKRCSHCWDWALTWRCHSVGSDLTAGREQLVIFFSGTDWMMSRMLQQVTAWHHHPVPHRRKDCPSRS